MTSIAASLSIDTRGPSALYIITDSRITWETSSARWDAGQKTFASSVSPDIFGFCGEAFFPPAILRQILEQINSGLLFDTSHTAADRHALLVAALKGAIKRISGAPTKWFAIFHGARDGELMPSTFRLWKTEYYASTDKCYDKELDLNETRSYLATIDGSGRNSIENRESVWMQSDAVGTSRAAIWSFCEALSSGADPRSGGPPQLVGIWRKGPARTFGFVWQDKRFFAGLEMTEGHRLNNVLWFNSLFERCDGETGARLANAQAHKKPTILETNR